MTLNAKHSQDKQHTHALLPLNTYPNAATASCPELVIGNLPQSLVPLASPIGDTHYQVGTNEAEQTEGQQGVGAMGASGGGSGGGERARDRQTQKTGRQAKKKVIETEIRETQT